MTAALEVKAPNLIQGVQWHDRCSSTRVAEPPARGIFPSPCCKLRHLCTRVLCHRCDFIDCSLAACHPRRYPSCWVYRVLQTVVQVHEVDSTHQRILDLMVRGAAIHKQANCLIVGCLSESENMQIRNAGGWCGECCL